MAQPSGTSGSFFPPWESAPDFVAQPTDQALEQRISKLAEFAVKNGPPFVEMIRQKQQNNQDYAFLSDGEGSGYFRWKLYCNLYSLEADRPLDSTPGSRPPHQAQTAPGTGPSHAPPQQDTLRVLEDAASELPPEVDHGFAAVLGSLTGTRTSIKDSKEWFMASIQHAPGLAAKMALHQRRLPGYEQQLHVIYLANDVLLKSLNQRPDNSGSGAEDVVARAFEPALPLMLHSAYQTGGASSEVEQRLVTILDHWAGREVYRPSVIEGMKRAIVHGLKPEPQAHSTPPNPQHTTAPQATPWQQPQPPAFAPASSHAWHGQAAPTPLATHPTPGGFPGGQPFQPPLPMHMPRGPTGWEGPPARPQAFYPDDPAFGYHHQPPQGFGPPPGQPGFAPPPGQQPMGLPGPMPGVGLPPQALQGFPGPHHHPAVTPGWNPGMPPAVGSFGAGPAGPQPPIADPRAEEPPPQQPITDPMSFPPGLLPALVEENLRTEEAYVPLSRRDVEAAGIPSFSEPSSYILARMDKFFAELQDYRQGTSKADLDDEQRRQRSRNSIGSGRAQPAPVQRTAPSDGSFRGERRDGGPAGLGFGNPAPSTAEDPSDPFSQYRRKRSGFYHDAITRATASANEPQPVT